MLSRFKLMNLILSLILGIEFIDSHNAFSANTVTLYTPYTKISVPPGESIDYAIDVINNTSELQNVGISVSGVPKGWTYTLKSGGWVIKQLSVLPGEKKSLSLKVDVPLQVNKGNYHIKVSAGSLGALFLEVNVSKEGTYKTEFSTDQANMEGHSTAIFTFNASLKNRTAEKQLYALKATSSPGWEVNFKANSKQVTSVEIEPNNNSSISIEVNPPDNIEAGTYSIPVSASTSSTSASINLQVVITGSYNMELTSPNGLLSSKITAGEKKRLELVVKNTGSSLLKNINLTSAAPLNWEVTFEPKTINELLPGSSVQVFAIVKADKKAIPGDYMTNFEAKTPELSSKASFRISVETPLVWGWIGILIILLAFGIVFYLFRNYGRR
jgi:uncharacterized membrane protein